MAEVIREDDEDELVIVEPEEEQAEEPEGKVAEEDDDEEDDDTRMGTSEDDSEQEITKRRPTDRRTRRELQKRARENAKRELEMLRQQNADLMQRMSAIEGNTLTQQAASIEQQYNDAMRETQQAEVIIAKAVEAGNGEDVAVAMRLRDEAKDRAQQLAYAKQQADQYAYQASQPQADPRVVDYAKQWLGANPWYNPNGRDEESMITKAIDNTLAAEGWNPSSEEYWHELTRRVASRISDDDGPTRGQAAPRRKAPPTGTTREHAPTSTKNQVVVTAERKQAMIDAGVWDDPVARTRYLKAYQAYDRENTAR